MIQSDIGEATQQQGHRDSTWRVRLIYQRFLRAAEAREDWARRATTATDFVEGRQWDDNLRAAKENAGQVCATNNEIAPLIRLMVGYHASNREDLKFSPDDDGLATEDVAELLSKLHKQNAIQRDFEHHEAAVFLDGLTTGRGFFDDRICFERNDLGENKMTALDPFNVFLDPDSESYDVNQHAFVIVAPWMSIEEIASLYGPRAARAAVRHDQAGAFPVHGDLDEWYPDVHRPPRGYGEYEGSWFGHTAAASGIYDNYNLFLDPYAKRIRVTECQYAIRTFSPCFVDLETGDYQPVPDDWDQERVATALYHAERLSNPVQVARRWVRRTRWTTLVGDIMVYDDWSPYNHYTITGFFPYFRRGMTRGAVEDLVDPQRARNEHRSLDMDTLRRTANGGWTVHEQGVRPDQEDALKTYGSTPGVVIKWHGDQPWYKPEPIQPNNRNMHAEKAEERNIDDLRRLSSINESALGELDRVQSGKAVEARQRQSAIGIQMYMDNYRYSRVLRARKWLGNVQRFYSEPRIIREIGETGSQAQQLLRINEVVTADDGITVIDRLNDVTVGRYSVSVDFTPVAATFDQAQFEETLAMLERMGPVGNTLLRLRPDLLVDQSSLPNKEEWRKAMQQALETANAQQATAMSAPGGDSAAYAQQQPA